MGDYSVSLSVIGALQENFGGYGAVMCENPKKTISLWFSGPKPILFWQSCAFYYWRTFLKQLGDYTVSLSAIEAMQSKYHREKWAKVSRSENQPPSNPWNFWSGK